MAFPTLSPDHGIVWITGADSGIGRALALRMAGEGFRVAVTAVSHERLVELAAEARGLSGSIIVLDGDVTVAADMERVVAAIEYERGMLVLAVLNADVCIPVHGEDLHVADFHQTFAVNLSGVANCLVPAVRLMRARGHGRIAIVSSVGGYGGLPAAAACGAANAALIHMAESLKFDFDRMGIGIQVVNPGFVATPEAGANAFGMPARISPQQAAEAIVAGLRGQAFEITFPRRCSYLMKALRLLPYGLYFAAINHLTGRRRRPAGNKADAAPTPAQ